MKIKRIKEKMEKDRKSKDGRQKNEGTNCNNF